MQKFAYLLVFCILSFFATGQRIVTQGEYFWDTDPGPGNGIAISATDGAFDEVVEDLFENGIDVSSLSVGAHNLNVRVKGQDGTWSNTFKYTIFLEGSNDPITRTVNITQGEFFWDADPGVGNGTALLALDGNFDQAVEELFANGIDVSSLSTGAHNFSVRLKGQDGAWSNVFRYAIYLEGPNLPITRSVNVTQGEYFWDTDPVPGSGTALLALDGNFDQAVEELFANGIDVSSLSVGAHNFSVRIKGQDGTWSNVFRYTIYIEGPNDPITRITTVTQGEYFWDADPGVGNGTALLALDGSFDQVVEELFANGIPTTSLSQGAHNFGVRVKGQDGTWSNVFQHAIYLEGPNVPITRIVKVTQAEYYWDTDPGQGNGSAILALDGTFDEVIEDLVQNNIPTTALSQGAHSFNVRVKGNDGNWSNDFKYTIYIEGANVVITRVSKIVQGEYYWDNDPGQGSGFPLLVSDGGFDEAIEEVFQNNIPTTSLSQGAHSFTVRVKGNDGNWSNDFKYTIYLEGQNIAITRNTRVIQGEYYWDTDPGQGNGLPLLATDGNFNTVIENLMQNIDASALAIGPHSLGTRVKGLDGQWSPVFRQTVYVECVTPTAPSITIAVTGNGSCMGSAVQFTATAVNGGTSPIYQWKLNGSNVGTNSATYSNASLVDGDIVTCELTSNSTCATTPNATSNSITVTLSSTVTPTITVAASPGNTNCYNTLVTFTATVTNEGTTPFYQWKVNGLNVGPNSSTFSSSTLLNGDVVTCELTSNATCASPLAVTSSPITMNITNNVTPSIVISTPSTTVCAGASTTFTAAPTNGGSTPNYQWKVNGVNAGTNSNTFTTSTLVNGDNVSCVLTSSETCVTTSTATSNVITITVPGALAPSVTIAQAPTGSVCSGTSVTFTASITNGGASPAYQWNVNGSPVGTNSASYSSSTLLNGDIVTCVVTSSTLCESGVTATSNSLTVTVTAPVTPSVSISAASTTICAGTAAAFTATPVNGGSANYQWSVNGTIVYAGPSTFNPTNLNTGDVVTCEMFTSLTCVTAASAVSNSITMTVNPNIPTSVVIAAVPGSSICAGTPVTFTATPTNGGTPSYQWQVNGSNVGTNSDTYTSSTLANGNTVRVLMTSNVVCPVPATATSNTITMTVTANVTPTASVSVSPSSTICAGTNVTFTASGSNLGATPSYQWYLNGSPVGTNSSTYSNSTLATGNTVNCVITSSVVCVTAPTATSNTVTMTVNAPVTPAVSISASATTICAGTNVTFTATPTNGGTPTYQWKLNGVNVGTNSTSYSTTALANGDVVTCTLTSSLSCVTSSTATSNAITMTVNPLNPTSVTIVANPGNSICAGTAVTFTATPTNGGTPSYQWQVNGSNVGTNSDTYTTSSLANGNTVRVLMTSSMGCPSPATATSNVITMTVTANVTPSVTIARTPTGTICAGTNVTFTATPTNGGATPSYQWYLNGAPVGTNSATYANNTLANGNTVSCVMTSSLACVTSSTATSNTITMTVTTPVTPAVSISASATTICAGTSVTFTATPTNGGTPIYQWKLNGSNVGTNSTTYSSSTLANGDVVTCVMTSSVSCVTSTTATSNAITMTVNPIVTTSVSIAANPGSSICAGSSVTFTATPTNGGTPSYQWQVNGSNVGTNSDTYTTSTLANGNTVRVLMTSSLGCTSPATATSNVITMTVTANVTPSVSIAASPGSSICSGTNVTFTATPTNGGVSPSYQWYLNGSPVGTNSSTYSNSTLVSGNTINCELTSSITCVTSPTATSNTVTMTVSTAVTPAVSISASATTICSGTNVTFTATPTNGGTPTYQWQVNGSNVGTNSSTYSSSGLSNNDVVTCVMTSSVACVTSSTTTSNAITMTVSSSFPASVSISANPGSTICTGTSVTFTATPTNGGATPSYQWYLNGSPVGTNSTTYTNGALSHGNIISCQMTSSLGCASPAVASNSVTMTVNAIVTPAVTVSPNTGTTACGGSVVTFTATPTNGGATPSYQWYLNGSPVGTNSSTYTNSTLTNGSNLYCVLTSSLMCLTQPTGTSNTVTMTITTPLTPAVTISASASTICVGSSVTFTATPTNGGSPDYQWYRNGSPVGTNSSTYTSSSLNNNDVISCVMTTSLSCVTSSTATSNSITMTVNPYISNSVSISSSTGSTSCFGSNVIFTATPTNGGATPTYIWYVNGTPVWSGSPYVTSTLTTGDVVVCEMSSSVTCPSPSTATSNSITMTVYSTNSPTASISSNQGAGVCVGGTINFSATGINIGTSPDYQWYLNGSPVGTNSPNYSISNPTDGHTVNCVITSNAPCVSGQTATSNTITINVVAPVTPAVSISTATTTVCSGSSVVFTASPTNGGGSPSYQWFRNGSPVGIGTSTYTTSTLSNGDVITCTLTSSLSCVTTSTASSNSITMTVSSSIPSSVSITSSGSTICFGTSVTFTASPTNGGATPDYQWYVNGSPVGTNSTTYTTSSLTNADVVTCHMTSSIGCASPATASSNSITMTVYSTNAPTASITSDMGAGVCIGGTVIFSASGTNIGGSPSYQWYFNGSPVGTNSASYSASNPSSGNTVYCVITSSASCVSGQTGTSNIITINTVSPVTPAVSISASATTICTGTSVTFTATPTNGGGLPSYQWYRNGSPVGGSGNSYTSSTLNNGDVVTCTLTSSLGCVTSSSANSNSITITVNPTVITSVSITSTQGTSVCDGQSVSFTATPVNGGTPTYQWYVNGSPVGTNSATYVTSTLTNGSVVYCAMTSSLSCPSPVTANSNAITMTVNGNVTPTISITANPGNTICGGTNITFTSSATNEGSSPTYQWFVNGAPVGTNSPTYSTSTLTNGNTVNCVVTSSTPCVTGPTASSNVITMNVTTPVAPSISINATATSICPGTNIVFTSAVTNEGASPVYQWTVNGSNVGMNSSTYSSSTLTNGDVVMCTLASSVTCVTSPSLNSNGITITVNPNTVSSVSINSTASTICSGTSVTFTATPVNGGTPTYQWFVNGSLVGTNSATYTSSTLNHNDVVTCQMTSSLPCNAPAVASSNAISMTVNSSVAPSISITSNQGSSICNGTNVTFTATPTNGGTTPSYQWQLNGSPVGTNATVYTNNSLVNGDVVNCILTSSATCPTTTTATSNSITLTVTTPVTPSVSISSSATTICAGTNITFTATPINGGGSPTYQWFSNGTPVGTNSATYSSTTLANADVITCTLTSSVSCVTSSTANSNSITITVNPSVTASVSISSSAGSTICAGTSVTFTATPTNGGTPTYQWYVNGSPVGTNSSTYTTSTLSNGQIITCQMTSSLSCPSPTTATSNAITMTVNSTVTPTISISSNQGSAVCGGTNVTFTATPTNGGATPGYQWFLNGSPVGTNSSTYSNNALANADVVNCILTSSATCPTTTTATSNSITFTVTTPVTPSVSINASATTICSGTSVTFSATPTNGGTPTYQWLVNGSPVGTNSSTFSSTLLNNGDVVTCEMTSSLTCVTSSTVLSNSVTMTVNPAVLALVSISSSAGSTICAGTSVTFTATPTNGGTPTYQWLVNGSPVGTNSDTYTTSTLTNGQIVTCEMTSSLSCPSPATATSNAITMTVNSTATPTISISSNQGNSICDGTSVTFTATITNGGATPTYEWFLNGSTVGTNSSSYTNSALNDADVVSCVLTSSATCPTTTTVTSNSITFTVSPVVTASVSISTTSPTTICSGTSVTFTATPANGGTPTYQWLVNGSPVGTNSSIFTTTTLTNGSIVSCEMTSSLACATPSPATSNTISFTVNSSATPTITITSNPSAATICSGTNVTFTANITNGGSSPSYQWYLNGSPVGTNASTYSNSTLNTGDAVTCELTSNAPCISVTTVMSNSISKTVNPSVTPTITITSNPTMPVCEQQSVTFTATITNGGSNPSYQWKKNGQNYGTGGSTYTTSLWSDGDVFTCVLTSNAPCATSTTVTSNAITADIVNIDATTSVSGNTITANQAGATYQWFDCTTQLPIPGATQQSYTVSSTGLYGVNITLGSCTEESGCEFVDFNALNEMANAGIVLYPNPTSDNFTLVLPENSHMQMILYDVAGRKVQEAMLDGMNHQIDVHNLATGSYQIVLTNGNTNYVGRVIINRQ